VLHGDEWTVRATVQARKKYQVRLWRDDLTVEVFCTCPYYDARLDPCRHIWATLLAAEAQGYLRGDGDGAPRYLEIAEDDAAEDDGEESWEDDGEESWHDREPEAWDDDDESDWDDEEDDFDASREFRPAPARKPKGPAPRVRKKARQRPNWKRHLADLRREAREEDGLGNAAWPAGRELLYVVDAPDTLAGDGLIIQVAHRDRKKDGDWSKPKGSRVGLSQIPQLPDPADRQILALLLGAREDNGYGYGYSPYHDSAPARYSLSAPAQDVLIPLMCQTGRCRLRVSDEDEDLRMIRWDEGGTWDLWLEVGSGASGKGYTIQGSLRRGDERVSLEAPVMLVGGGLVFWDERAARLQDFGAFDWISLLRTHGSLSVPAKDKDELLKELLGMPNLPQLDLPPELRYEEVAIAPRPRLKVRAPDRQAWGQPRLRGEMSFDYDGEIVPANRRGRGLYQPQRQRRIVRDLAAEAAAAERLRLLGFRPPAYSYGEEHLELAPRNLPRVIRALLEAGWHVEADGKLYQQPGAVHVSVSSGIDWFELHGSVEFGDTVAHLPELLAAVRRGEKTVQLGDGTFGMLPEDWLKKYGLLAGLGKVEGEHLRFSRTQVGLLDALLAAQPGATCDAVFARVRDELHGFAGVEPADPPAGFVGQLRAYQRDGQGWLYFLQRFSFGGCLADDMGLGKTVQVLALLESRRALRTSTAKAGGRPGPSLVVVPRSLVFNWKQEAARFTPDLRVLDHTGVTRLRPGPHFDDYDLVVTTYGTLRRDAVYFKDVHFDYCILDEAQTVKNAHSESAKAVRLLRGDHRLAMSGTPVENHLGELWSLFEFLNPGMLGSASVFRLGTSAARQPDEETRGLLARALRPFILRRTKEQVAKDLPQKLEQTLYCELEPAQRKLYDELRDHYKRALLERIERDGIRKSKIQILEALLRLRQAALHPGLIDTKKSSQPSAKLDALLPQLAEVLDEGHKVLVFSQFTSMLAIVRERLDREGVCYEYLDGHTRDREARVERFQNDPECRLFLISLKAGGLGLNLTAAEYVFLLDPWWNPAVEAQAIDRSHRIGQTRRVFAYRLIARDTVEEKVLELQRAKRELADSIINADNSVIGNLGRDDLELLLS
jgi:superfamily II DNA or RNA helicase